MSGKIISSTPDQVTILAVGSRGDIQPYCALGLGLKAAGHRVRIATNRSFESFVTGLGFEFAPIAGDYKELLNSKEGQKLLAGKSSKLISDELLITQMRDAIAASQGTELFIFTTLAIWGYHIAEKLDVPSFLATSIPLSATKQFPFLQFWQQADNSVVKTLNLASYRLVEFLNWQQNRSLVAQFRKEIGLPALPFLGARFRTHAPKYLSPTPILYGFSPSLVPRPQDWNTEAYITGDWFLGRAGSYSAPAALSEFLQAGAPPLCVGFGSMTGDLVFNATKLIFEALEATGDRAVILSGWSDLKAELPRSLRDQLFLIDAVPHDWLFPQVAAVIHHGGAGTTAAVCRAGVPSIVIPFFADQPAWGKILVKLGVSPASIPCRELTLSALTAAIRSVTEPVYKQRAIQLGEAIQQEDGVKTAVEIIHKYLPNQSARC